MTTHIHTRDNIVSTKKHSKLSNDLLDTNTEKQKVIRLKKLFCLGKKSTQEVAKHSVRVKPEAKTIQLLLADGSK